ncbi:NAD(P)-dependent alcohol dehydrogenase [Hoyosella rhizosphaerae]|nr:NAD(P)-dependent alcohol dehydrogenase [Hoyosella rhizosphaerae]
MTAAVCNRYGPPEVVTLAEIPKPRPKADEVRVRVRATTVSAGDYRVRSHNVPAGFGLLSRLALGIRKPRQPILGTELSGDIDQIGAKVTEFAVGDPVVLFGDAAMGCHAQYRCISEDGSIVRKPRNLSYKQAAALSFGGTTALHFLRKARIKPGERVLVYGASGSVGTACVQLAQQFGAHVTAVCSSPNIDLVRSLGADEVVDYTTTDYTRTEQTYDVIVDTVGSAGYSRSKSVLNRGGRLLLVHGTLMQLIIAPWLTLTTQTKVIPGVALGRKQDLAFLAELAEKGLFTPVIDRTYPLTEIANAHRYVETRRKRGNVVISVAE